MRTGWFSPRQAWVISGRVKEYSDAKNRPDYVWVDGVQYRCNYILSDELAKKHKAHMRAIQKSFEWLYKP